MAGHTHSHSGAGAHDHGDHAHGGSHGGPKLYWTFAIILCAITFVEWAIFKYKVELGVTNAVMVPALLVMSLVKFVMVVGWYMHLKYDPGWMKKIFVASLVMGGGTAIVLVVLMAKPLVMP